MRWWMWWPVWTRWVALVSSGGYVVVGAIWATIGAGFPFGARDPGAADNGTLLIGATPPATGWVTVLIGLLGAVTAGAMALPARHGGARYRLVVGVGFGMAVLLALVLPERRGILTLPPLGLLAVLRPPDLPTVHFVGLMLLGFVWAAATLAYRRRCRAACVHCGRSSSGDVAAGSHRAATVLTWIAILAPWAYALTRIGWAAGIPVGVTPDYLARLDAANPGNLTMIMELTLASFAIAGSLLTVGLLRPWGRRFPRWAPVLGGRRVPPAFPTTFAGLVAVELTAWGLSMVRDVGPFLAGGMRAEGFQMGPLWLLPPIAILVWGVSLGGAILAYHRRRRGPCRHCGRGAGAGRQVPGRSDEPAR